MRAIKYWRTTYVTILGTLIKTIFKEHIYSYDISHGLEKNAKFPKPIHYISKVILCSMPLVIQTPIFFLLILCLGVIGTSKYQ